MEYTTGNIILTSIICLVIFFSFYIISNYIQSTLSARKKLQNRISALSDQKVNMVDDFNLFSDQPDVGVIEKRIHALLTPVNKSKRLKLWFTQSGIEIPLMTIVINIFSFSIIAIAISQLFYDWPLIKVIFIVFSFSIFGTIFIIKIIRKKRQEAIIADLPSALIMLAQFLKAGFNLDGALEVCAKETPGDLGAEIKKILLQNNSGVMYEDSLRDSAATIGINAYSIFMGALIIQHRIGASAALVIENIILILQKRTELEAKIKIMSAEATATYAILILTQILLASALWYNNPTQMMYFFRDPTGQNIATIIAFLVTTQFVSFKMLTKIRME